MCVTWKKVKKAATHLKFFPTFATLTQEVDIVLGRFANTPHIGSHICLSSHLRPA
jgi:hypothetical protein